MNAPAATVNRVLVEAGSQPTQYALRQARHLYQTLGHSLRQAAGDTVRKHWNRGYPQDPGARRKEFARRNRVIREYLKSLPEQE